MNSINICGVAKTSTPWMVAFLVASNLQNGRADDLDDFNAGNINGWQTFDIGQILKASHVPGA